MVADWLSPKAHTRLIHTLREFYGDVLMERGGATYPIVVQSIASPTIEALLGNLEEAYLTAQDFVFYDEKHLDHLIKTRTLNNGLCYALKTIQDGVLHAKLGYYFDMLATCDALDQELRAYARQERDDVSLRQQLHACVPQNQWLWHGTGRSATVGLAGLVVFYHDGAYRLIFCQRSNAMAVNAGLYHVLPAFVFQPNLPQWAKAEWSLEHQFLREFGEELFGIPEFSGTETTPIYFYHHAAIADMRAMLADGRAQLLPTGAIFNLMSMRSELAFLCIIHDPQWYKRNLAGLNAALDVERQATFYIPIDTLAGLPEDLHLKMTPQGAGVFWLGLEKAREVLNR